MAITNEIHSETCVPTEETIADRAIAVTMVPPIPRKAVIRVAVYCRVSTNSGEQEGSLVAQREHFRLMISEHPNWELRDFYCERGVSGTKSENRVELQRLLRDCRGGQVDLVLTKSISRFARNTIDCLEMVRELSALGIRILFEKKNIDTLSIDAEFLMTILASLAEEESRSISGNNRWAIQKRFRSGTYRPGTAPYGYDLIDGELKINKAEAEVVMNVFKMYLSGVGSSAIADELNLTHIPCKRSGQIWNGVEKQAKWDRSTIIRMLRNVDYIGDALLQQTYRDAHFRRRQNHGEYDQVYVTGRHTSIVPRELFDKAQTLLAVRGKRADSQRTHDYLSGRIYCGRCGSVRIRTTRHADAPNRVQWECKGHKQRQCPERSVLDENIRNAWMTMLNKLRFATPILETFIEDCQSAWESEHPEMTALRERLVELDRIRRASEMRYAMGEIKAATLLKKRICVRSEEEMVEARLNAMVCPEAERAQRFMEAMLDEVNAGALFSEYVDRVDCTSRTEFRFCFSFGLILTERCNT